MAGRASGRSFAYRACSAGSRAVARCFQNATWSALRRRVDSTPPPPERRRRPLGRLRSLTCAQT
eukprot:10836878-Alexandrium_andersonii.AAC.1